MATNLQQAIEELDLSNLQLEPIDGGKLRLMVLYGAENRRSIASFEMPQLEGRIFERILSDLAALRKEVAALRKASREKVPV